MQVSSENASADYFVPVSVPSIQQSNITSFITREAAIRAEILWSIKCVLGHFLFNSSSYICALFKVMFPDSGIAQNFSLG